MKTVYVFIYSFTLFLLFRTSLCLFKDVKEIQTIENGDQMNQLLSRKDQVYLVQFYATWCRVSRGFSEDFGKIAKALKNDVTTIAIKNEDLANKYKVTTFPSVQLFFTKENPENVYIEKFSDDLKVKNVVLFVFDTIKKFRLKQLNIDVGSDKSSNKKNKTKEGKVIILTDKNFDKLVLQNDDNAWFVFFYAPWCGHSKPIHPYFDELAKKVTYMKNVKIAKIDATTEQTSAQRFRIQHYPSFRFFPTGNKTVSSAVDYKEERGTEEFYNFILRNYKEKKEVIQLTSNEQYEELCEKDVCLIAILPSLEDTEMKYFKSYVETLEKVLPSVRDLPVTFLWVIASDQLEMVQKLNLMFGFPTIIAIKVSKNIYSILKGNYSEKSIKNFIIQMMTGKASVENLVPFKIKTTSKLDLNAASSTSKQTSDEL